MEWYEDTLVWSIIGVIIGTSTGITILGLMMYYRHQDNRGQKKNTYVEHIKDLINKLHSEATRNEHDKIGHGYYGLISGSTYKTQILDHLKTNEKDDLTDTYSFFNKITEKRKERITKPQTEEEKAKSLGQFFDTKKLQEEFDQKIYALHERVNHDAKPNLGFCQDCLENITSNKISRWLKKRQLS